MILFSTDANWASQSEFESVVAHEFAHAAAGLRNGTPAECYDAKAGGRGPEDCAVNEQNKVHGQIGYRNRSSYEDTGPFKSSGSEEKKKP